MVNIIITQFRLIFQKVFLCSIIIQKPFKDLQPLAYKKNEVIQYHISRIFIFPPIALHHENEAIHHVHYDRDENDGDARNLLYGHAHDLHDYALSDGDGGGDDRVSDHGHDDGGDRGHDRDDGGLHSIKDFIRFSLKKSPTKIETMSQK